MADCFTVAKRSQIMKSVKSNRNKSTELKLIRFFRQHKIVGWRRKYKLFGKPDFTFLSLRVLIFVDGCFWHGHNCRNTKPKTNSSYWIRKFSGNKKRDELVNKYLKSKKWHIIRIWECELNNTNLALRKLYSLINLCQ